MPTDDYQQIYNFREIRAGLVTGGQPSEAQLRSLAAAGYRWVINLAMHDDPRYSLPDEPGLVRELGMQYRHVPVIWEQPRREDLEAFFAALDEAGHAPTLVHCAANMRVSAFVGLYLVLREGREPDEAFSTMRSIWQPEGVWAEFIDEALGRSA